MNPIVNGLEAEFAAIYAYGAFTHFLGSSTRELAIEVEEEHRVRRDQLLSWFHDSDHDAPTPAATYEVGEVEGGSQAVEALVDVEAAVATAWRSGLASDDLEQREQCLEMLQHCVVVLGRWRAALGEIPTDPWPGRP